MPYCSAYGAEADRAGEETRGYLTAFFVEDPVKGVQSRLAARLRLEAVPQAHALVVGPKPLRHGPGGQFFNGYADQAGYQLQSSECRFAIIQNRLTPLTTPNKARALAYQSLLAIERRVAVTLEGARLARISPSGSGDMIFVTDAEGQTIHTSSDWPNLTGQSVEDALGLGWLDCVHPEDRAIIERTLKEAISRVSEFSIRYRLINPSGKYRWVGVGGIPSIGPPQYTFIGYLGSLTEITEGATAEMQAYGNVERFIPPPTHPATIASDHLDQIADYLILAHSLIEEDGAQSALPGLKFALFEVGCALASREKTRRNPN